MTYPRESELRQILFPLNSGPVLISSAELYNLKNLDCLINYFKYYNVKQSSLCFFNCILRGKQRGTPLRSLYSSFETSLLLFLSLGVLRTLSLDVGICLFVKYLFIYLFVWLHQVVVAEPE